MTDLPQSVITLWFESGEAAERDERVLANAREQLLEPHRGPAAAVLAESARRREPPEVECMRSGCEHQAPWDERWVERAHGVLYWTCPACLEPCDLLRVVDGEEGWVTTVEAMEREAKRRQANRHRVLLALVLLALGGVASPLFL